MKRADHWQRVESGTDIPIGQPHRVEYDGTYAEEDVQDKVLTVPHSTKGEWFIDSSWKPPLVLPTEPTWGIAVTDTGTWANHWGPSGNSWAALMATDGAIARDLIDFIPLTDEQVARIEAAR